jgi:hypothetical protein
MQQLLSVMLLLNELIPKLRTTSLSPEFEIIDQSSDQEKSYETFIDMSIKLVLR